MPKRSRGQYEFDVFPAGTLKLTDVDLSPRASESYEEQLEALQTDLFHLQVETFQKQRRVVLAFEGWDAAGKGGVIKRLTALMDPRGYRVWPIGAPRDAEQRHHYLWRFWNRLPERGEIAVFDRTWYGRVLVERVEGFCPNEAWKRAYDEINAFEHMLTQDGVRLAKFFLHIDKKTQLARFKDREKDPFKHYKIGEEDWRNRNKWDKYELAIQEMLDRTHRPDAEWHLIPSDDKKHARLEVLRRCKALLRGGA
jgi:polyphosphate kinase 2 (PPK2 family)